MKNLVGGYVSPAGTEEQLGNGTYKTSKNFNSSLISTQSCGANVVTLHLLHSNFLKPTRLSWVFFIQKHSAKVTEWSVLSPSLHLIWWKRDGMDGSATTFNNNNNKSIINNKYFLIQLSKPTHPQKNLARSDCWLHVYLLKPFYPS